MKRRDTFTHFKFVLIVIAMTVFSIGLFAPRHALGAQNHPEGTYKLDKDYVLHTRARTLDQLESSYINLKEIVLQRGYHNLGSKLTQLDETIGEAALLFEILQDLDRTDWTNVNNTLDRKIARAQSLSTEIGKDIDSRL